MASDAVTVIKRDHRLMQELFERLTDPSVDRRALVEECAQRMHAHSKAEEDHVFPEIVRADRSDVEEVHQGVEEHRQAEEKLAVLRATDPQSPNFERAAREFTAAARRHIEDEESQILAHLGRTLNQAKLEKLGAAFEKCRLTELRRHGIETGPAVGATPGHTV